MDINIDYTSSHNNKQLSINSSSGGGHQLDDDHHVTVHHPNILHQISSSSSYHQNPSLIWPPPLHHHQLLLAANNNNDNNNNIFMELDDNHHRDEDHQDHDQDQTGGDEEDNDELGAMKEMMYKIAAMQPVDVDPATIRKPKRRNVRISDDPQSVAARHRRERISEKIRILQRLVPGGTKMDTASMLDEAIRYVKFLKRQIRLLQSPSSMSSNNNILHNININDIDDHHQRHPPSHHQAAHDDHDRCNIDNIINNGSSSVGATASVIGGLPLDWPPPPLHHHHQHGGSNNIPSSSSSTSTRHHDS